jgi:hypothetical protein
VCKSKGGQVLSSKLRNVQCVWGTGRGTHGPSLLIEILPGKGGVPQECRHIEDQRGLGELPPPPLSELGHLAGPAQLGLHQRLLQLGGLERVKDEPPLGKGLQHRPRSYMHRLVAIWVYRRAC